VLFHPSAYENLFLPTAHSREDVAVTLAAASDVADALARAA
jgi:glutamate-1-semialdehyde 2,1-aminomutase